MSVEVERMSFAYRGHPVLREISLSLKPGEFLGFLGPNGSGKSTFLKNILGFLKPSQGRIVFSGTTTPPTQEERSRRISYLPQNPVLHGSLLVKEVIILGRLPRVKDRWAGYGKADWRKAAEVMEILGISGLAERKVTELSGGERQKVIIGRCLVQEGDILLLDEVTAGLDLNHAIEIMEFMRRKAGREGKTIVAVLHDLNLASQYCDRIVLLKEGCLRYQGSPREVITGKVVEEIYGIRAVIQSDGEGRPVVLPKRNSEE
ncbi:MAG: ABC transporter ATP-binding protein [Spirochaetaceae bacterium]|jgi:iron complex transport system ATP-binding protein|nr:ABC transporter ATP-binding protein [Spirochaetaceae bacterium]